MTTSRVVVATFLILTGFFWCPLTYAVIVINEFAAAPNQSVELFNSGSSSVDISGWYLDDSGGTTFVTIQGSTTIYPSSCIVINGSFNFNTASADVARLFDNSAPPTAANAHLIDSYSYTTAPAANQSYARNPDATGNFSIAASSFGKSNSNGQSCEFVPTLTPTIAPTETPTPTPTNSPSPIPSQTQTPTATPTKTQTPTNTPTFTKTPSPTHTASPTTTSTPIESPTATPTPTPSFASVLLSEFAPYPDGDKEWVELYNGNKFSINLNKWSIDDIENSGGSPYVFTTSIPAFGYVTIDLPSYRFNNDGDSVRLLNDSGIEIDNTSYEGSVKSYGFAKQGNGLWCTAAYSKGVANTGCVDLDTPSATPSPTHTPTPSKTQTPTKTPSPTPTSKSSPTPESSQLSNKTFTPSNTQKIQPLGIYTNGSVKENTPSPEIVVSGGGGSNKNSGAKQSSDLAEYLPTIPGILLAVYGIIEIARKYHLALLGSF